jgi:fumarate reductase (CoM/CoB) subunit A
VIELEAEVLVVGGGLAALRAAYEALGAGASVAVAVKGKAGRSGSSAMTSAGYSAAEVSLGDSPRRHLLDTLAGGRGLNDPELARIMTEEGPERLHELEAMGAPLAHTESGARLVNPSGDHSIPRVYVTENHSGRDFTEPLAAAVRARGGTVLEMTAVVDVLHENGEVAGGVGVDYERGELVVIRAASVILGTGGAGRLFAVTSNPNDATGDGYALALRAGADLRDMEFIQFYPWRCTIPFGRSRMPIQPSTFVLGGKLWNSKDERFMLAYDPVRAEATTRDVAARGIYDQIHGGLDVKGGVRLDLSDVKFEDWIRSNPRPARHFLDRGLDVYAEELIIAPEAHFFMGGVSIGPQAETAVTGLYAVGEAAGGVHGANRLDSNALPETQVFGARAGRSAAGRRADGRAPSARRRPGAVRRAAQASAERDVAKTRNRPRGGGDGARPGRARTAGVRSQPLDAGGREGAGRARVPGELAAGRAVLFRVGTASPGEPWCPLPAGLPGAGRRPLAAVPAPHAGSLREVEPARAADCRGGNGLMPGGIPWDWGFAWRTLPFLLSGLRFTLEATLLGCSIAFALGLVLSMVRMAQVRVASGIVGFFVEFIRGTPLLIQLYFLFYIFPDYGITLPALLVGVLGLGVYYSAYASEVYRAAIEGVPRGQWEAALALGLPLAHTWGRVVLPQALKFAVPVLGNFVIGMFKESAILSTITVMEVIAQANVVVSQSFRAVEPFTLAGAIFFVISYPSARLVRALEARLR